MRSDQSTPTVVRRCQRVPRGSALAKAACSPTPAPVPLEVVVVSSAATTHAGDRATTQAALQRPASEYDDVADMFREMHSHPAGSLKWERAREAIVRRCMPLAAHIAQRFSGRGESSEDVVQVARLGLVNAVNRFDVDAGSDFVAYAVPTIMGEVRRHFRDNSWAVKVPRRLKERNLEVGRASAEMSQRLGRAPTPSELAAHLGLEKEEVVETLVAGSGYYTLSIDSPGRAGDDERPPLAETLGDIDANLDQIENREALRPLLQALPERERNLIALRFFESLTQTQIAERLGISQMHVSRLLALTLAKLRDQLQRPA